MIDLKLFAILAVAVIFIGGFLWWKPKSSGNVSKSSGIGDHGQKK